MINREKINEGETVDGRGDMKPEETMQYKLIGKLRRKLDKTQLGDLMCSN